MSAFVFVRGDGAEDRACGLQKKLEELGIHFDQHAAVPEGRLLFRSNRHLGGDDFVRRDADTFAYFTGTLLFRGQFGRAALTGFLDALDEARPPLGECRGQFCLIVRKNNTLFLFTDRLGMNKLYCDSGQSVFSSLFLGVAEAVKYPRIDTQGCYEYAWNGVSAGERTFYEQVRTVPVEHFLVIRDRVETTALPSLDLRDNDARRLPTAELVERHVARGQALFAAYARNFDNRINLSMSGGYDSRLLLAFIMDAGIKPRLFSYGIENNVGDEIAAVRRIAEGENLAFECVDKSQRRQLSPGEYADDFKQTFGAFDGWRVDGIFDTGADRLDRTERVEAGRLKVNGSGGEIYRNFFYLRNRRLAARELVWSFYSRFDRRWCTSAFVPAQYVDQLASLIAKQVGADGPVLKRYQVELAYPLFRLRYWTARDVQLNQGFGLCLFPFLEPELIAGTCDIPIRLKCHGLFEGRMIRKLNARVAAYPSDYGFTMATDPPWWYRLKAQLTYSRPPFVRSLVYRMRRHASEAEPYFLSRQYLSALIDIDFPVMSHYFRVGAIRNSTVLNRVATMEYHARRHSAHS